MVCVFVFVRWRRSFQHNKQGARIGGYMSGVPHPHLRSCDPGCRVALVVPFVHTTVCGSRRASLTQHSLCTHAASVHVRCVCFVVSVCVLRGLCVWCTMSVMVKSGGL